MSAEILVGIAIIGVIIAVVERGLKRYYDEKAENPTIKFSSSYIINILISGGGMSAIIIGVLPVVAENFQNPEQPIAITVFSVMSAFGFGYLTTFRILDGLNNRTEEKVEVARIHNTPTATTATTTFTTDIVPTETDNKNNTPTPVR